MNGENLLEKIKAQLINANAALRLNEIAVGENRNHVWNVVSALIYAGKINNSDGHYIWSENVRE